MYVRGPSGFKFEESWLMWDGCEDVVTEAWSSGFVGGSALDVIRQQIAICGSELHAWGASKTHPDKEEIKLLRNRLAALDHGPSTVQARNQFVELSKTLDDLLRKQEIYWHQKARIAWMKHGDKNTKMEECLAQVPQKVTADMCEVPTKDFEAEEIRAALFQMGPTNAPGLDGNMVNEINFTYIVLIPKIKVSEKITDYRSISLCNVIYKIIAKVLANHLKQILPHVISPT
ncbi:uncharacterized protein LOC142629211 [Castanea sativa]|uniref:uncharacterized protein LOC142629211 n=1 Tax=Castanea sativa TaxID=21020 RepID=UPI003F64E6EC